MVNDRRLVVWYGCDGGVMHEIIFVLLSLKLVMGVI